MTYEEIRKAFERWYSDNGTYPNAVERSGEGYRLMQAQQSWNAWQACADTYTILAAQPSNYCSHCAFPHSQCQCAVKALEAAYRKPSSAKPAMVVDHTHEWLNTQIIGFGKGQVCIHCGALQDTFGNPIE